MKQNCKSCQCSRCGNDTCDWCRCEKNEPTEECYQSDCRDYGNEQEEIEEGFLDGYE